MSERIKTLLEHIRQSDDKEVRNALLDTIEKHIDDIGTENNRLIKKLMGKEKE